MNQELKESNFLGLLNDRDFEKIELQLQAVNFFDIIGATRSEIRHSNFLSWILNPNENHGLGELVLKKFLRDIFSNDKATEFSGLDAESFDFGEVSTRREWQKIDILVLNNDVAIVIENKVDSQESSNQLKKYQTVVKENFPNHKHVFVLLTPSAEPAKKAEDREKYIEYSYSKISEILDGILEIHNDRLSTKTQFYLEDYRKVLRRSIMKDDELNQLALKLYKAHSHALDFIFENRPDLQQEVNEALTALIEREGYVLGSTTKVLVRFTTPELEKIIPRHPQANGWTNSETFLFEFIISTTNANLKLNLKTVISQGNHPAREYLKETISKIEGAKKPSGKNWLIHFNKSKSFNKEKLYEMTHDEKVDHFSSFLQSNKAMIENVERAILKDSRINKSSDE